MSGATLLEDPQIKDVSPLDTHKTTELTQKVCQHTLGIPGGELSRYVSILSRFREVNSEGMSAYSPDSGGG